ncbi:MAG: aminotransferase class III-fold pyridoxal phosphate-dependent enzyme, partial [Gammaproteobacteria bacterium]|nr:aminotransferase class III-fold pyridoxal phosphate-dependent enzyme [Gammaproteobacteria bacterium]
AKVADLEAAILSLGADKVAAFIAEPILASGGVVIPPKGYQRRCSEICQKYDVLYIADEVVTGFGRLGHWFASEAVFDMVPDLMTSAKGLTSGYLPLGACFISDRLMQNLQGKEATFANGYTYSGHPVSCAAALKNIDIMQQEQVLEHVQSIAAYFLRGLERLRSLPIVRDVRAIGLVGCVECSIDPQGNASLEEDAKLGYRIDAHCQALGLIVRPIINMCVLSPALIITPPQIDQMVDILEQGIRLTVADLQNQGLLGKD